MYRTLDRNNDADVLAMPASDVQDEQVGILDVAQRQVVRRSVEWRNL